MNREIEIGLEDIFHIIKRRFIWLVITALICGGALWSISKYAIVPMYTATASMYVFSDSSREAENSTAITSSELSASKTLVDTYIVIIKSDTVMDQVIAHLNLDYSAGQLRGMMSAASVNSTEAFSISITNADPQLAKNIANAIVKIAPPEIVRVVKAGGVEVIDYAKLPTVPSSPNIVRYTVIGALAGLVLCFLAFLLSEIFNVVIRYEEDLDRLFDVPVLGTIPKLIESETNKPAKGGDR